MQVARYWVTSIAVVGMLTVVGWVFISPGAGALVASAETLRSVFSCLTMATIVTALLMPLVLYDVVRLSHKFAGPMVRLRNSMKRCAAGQAVEPVHFREGDFWQEIADSFNAIQARIEALEAGSVDGKAQAIAEQAPSVELDSNEEPDDADQQGVDEGALVCS